MKLYRTELDSGLDNKKILVESSTIGIKNVIGHIKCIISCDKTSTGYRIYGNVLCNNKFSCDRCLIEIEKNIKTSLNTLLTNNKDIVKDKDTDVIMFTKSDDFIDLSSILHDIIEVEKPIKSLCSDDCKGICPSCGLDLNRSNCNCKDNSSINELNKLKDLIK
tara:strand:+ start:1597 stop:2085 length:489 start_codon:yes stop_codon:yes gene_type:complete